MKHSLQNFGMGIDIVDIERFKKLPFSKNKDFYKKIFSDSEIKYCLKFNEPYEHFAAKFAIKESVIKSLGKKLPLTSIITDHKNLRPIVEIKNSSEYFFKVTLSHEEEFAVAVVMFEIDIEDAEVVMYLYRLNAFLLDTG